jgi:aminoglycoside phosphotransferase (APT) family kinase protein
MVDQPSIRPSLDELRNSLEQVLTTYYDKPVAIRKLHRRRSRYSSSYSIENLEAELTDGARHRLVLKDTSPAAATAFKHHVRPGWVSSPEREIEVYQSVLDPHFDLGTPICFGAIRLVDRQRYWLFLERVTGVALWQLGRMEPWQEAARWLARFHTVLQADAVLKSASPCPQLIQYNQAFLRTWAERADRFLGQRTTHLSPSVQKRFARLIANYDRVTEGILALPKSLIHGEFYPSNVLVRREQPTPAESAALKSRICVVDWEMAGIGPGLIDLAALTSGKWSDEAKRGMVMAYRAAMEPNRGWPPNLIELTRAVELCQLHLAMQWLGWAESWSPPGDHAHDWLQEVLRLADRLDL